MRGLRDKVSVVVGGGPGNIGGATATRLAEEGSLVVVSDLDISAAQSVAEDISASGGRALACAVDISSPESVTALFRFAIDQAGGVDNVFNVAADLSPQTMGADSAADIVDLPLEVWKRTLDVDLTGFMLCAKAAIPAMLERGGGSIVNTTSAAAWMAAPVRAAYSTAKLGIEAMTRHTASAYGRRGIRANSVAPGLVLTATARRVIPATDQDAQLAELPTTRLGLPEDIAGAVAFLMSDDAVWINGQTIHVDGGRIMR